MTMEMEYYRCENPDCGFVAENQEPDVCPRCGGTFFLSVPEEELGRLVGLVEVLDSLLLSLTGTISGIKSRQSSEKYFANHRKNVAILA